MSNNGSHNYYGASNGDLSLYNNHTNSFRHRQLEQNGKLSKHMWQLQDKGINFT